MIEIDKANMEPAQPPNPSEAKNNGIDDGSWWDKFWDAINGNHYHDINDTDIPEIATSPPRDNFLDELEASIARKGTANWWCTNEALEKTYLYTLPIFTLAAVLTNLVIVAVFTSHRMKVSLDSYST